MLLSKKVLIIGVEIDQYNKFYWILQASWYK